MKCQEIFFDQDKPTLVYFRGLPSVYNRNRQTLGIGQLDFNLINKMRTHIVLIYHVNFHVIIEIIFLSIRDLQFSYTIMIVIIFVIIKSLTMHGKRSEVREK